MDIFTIVFWVIAIIFFVISLAKYKKETLESIKKSKGMMGRMLSDVIAIIFLIGLILALIPPEVIENTLGSGNTFIAVIIAAAIGSITLIPPIVAFPLVGSLVNVGTSIVSAASFLTTLTMVGVVTFPLEKKEFGLKFALNRNILSFCFAIIIALLMGVIL